MAPAGRKSTVIREADRCLMTHRRCSQTLALVQGALGALEVIRSVKASARSSWTTRGDRSPRRGHVPPSQCSATRSSTTAQISLRRSAATRSSRLTRSGILGQILIRIRIRRRRPPLRRRLRHPERCLSTRIIFLLRVRPRSRLHRIHTIRLRRLRLRRLQHQFLCRSLLRLRLQHRPQWPHIIRAPLQPQVWRPLSRGHRMVCEVVAASRVCNDTRISSANASRQNHFSRIGRYNFIFCLTFHQSIYIYLYEYY